MGIITNTFDGGSNTTAMTTGNTGGTSGTAFTAVTPEATFSTDRAHSGALSMKLPPVVEGYGRWAVGDKNVSYRAYIWAGAAHAEDCTLLAGRVTTSSNIVLLLLNGESKLRIRRGVDSTNVWTAASALPLNQWVRVELLIEMGTTTSNGRVRFAYYLGESETPVQDSGWLTGNYRGDTGTLGQMYIGKIGSATLAGALHTDSVEIRSGVDHAGDFIGPVPVPPTGAPIYRWDGSEYVAVESWRWDGSDYVAVERPE